MWDDACKFIGKCISDFTDCQAVVSSVDINDEVEVSSAVLAALVLDEDDLASLCSRLFSLSFTFRFGSCTGWVVGFSVFLDGFSYLFVI